MPASDVQIAKLALQHLGDRYDITDLSEATPEAEQVNLVFEDLRDALLREYPWKFSLRYTKPPTLIGTAPAQWTYMFTYPPEALKVWRIVHPLDPRGDTLPPIPFSVAQNDVGVKVLLTDQSEPEFEFTQRVTNPAEFDPNFVMALSWRIAEHIAMPLTGSEAIAARAERQSLIKVQAAKVEDGNEGISRSQTRDPDWLRARGGSTLLW